MINGFVVLHFQVTSGLNNHGRLMSVLNFFLQKINLFYSHINDARPASSSQSVDYLTNNVNYLDNVNFVATFFHLLQVKLIISKFLLKRL